MCKEINGLIHLNAQILEAKLLSYFKKCVHPSDGHLESEVLVRADDHKLRFSNISPNLRFPLVYVQVEV